MTGVTALQIDERRRQRIALELAGHPAKVAAGPQPGHEYVTAKQAIALCGLAQANSSVSVLCALPRVKCGPRGAHIGGKRPYLYRREHIRRVRELIDQAGLALTTAVRVVLAELEGRL